MFGGWWTAASGGSKVTTSTTVTPASTRTLYAHWTPANYTVVFKANGGAGSMPRQTFVRGKAAKLTANKFKRSGYVFIGWAKSASGAVAYADRASAKNLAAAGKTATLYARWAKQRYKVKFVANGGKGSMPIQAMTYGKATTLSANQFARDGFTFAGWAKSAKGAVVYKNRHKVKNLDAKGKTVKLYAVWEPKGGNFGTVSPDGSVAFTTGGNAKWSVSEIDGVTVALSGKIGDNKSTWIKFTAKGPGTLNFKYGVSSEAKYDKLVYSSDGETIVVASGNKRSGVTDTVYGSGPHVFMWKFEKDASRSGGMDCAWIYDVRWKPAK